MPAPWPPDHPRHPRRHAAGAEETPRRPSQAEVQEKPQELQEKPSVTSSQSVQPELQELTWRLTAASICGTLAFLYLLLIGLGLIGDAFECIGSRGATRAISGVDNPIAGLMVGILATVLVQSSSYSTAVVVTLVSSDQISVTNGIPIIMGANIGTSVTNTIVSLGQMHNNIDLERAFAGATVHDMFNMLTVLVLLPLEIIISLIQGEGGLLYWISKNLTSALQNAGAKGKVFPSPIKEITKPVTKAIISNNKGVISALSMEPPIAVPLVGGEFNATLCGAQRFEADGSESLEEETSRALLSPRLSHLTCSEYYCVSKELDKQFKKINPQAYSSRLTECGAYVLLDQPCTTGTCYLEAGTYYQRYVTDGHIISGGLVQGAGDTAGGAIAVILSVIALYGGLFGVVKCLQVLLVRKARKTIARATRLNNYIAIVVGTSLTVLVQSSSISTSALTPLCGMGIIPLEKMLPLTLGANIGTTVTALLAALVTMKFGAMQIAMCHLLFNIIGICIWFPLPCMREVPLTAARLLGLYASVYRFVPGLYIVLVFVAVPIGTLGLVAFYEINNTVGEFFILLLVAAVVAFEFWWILMGGCYKVVSEEERKLRMEELERSNSAVRAEEREEEAEEPPPSADGPQRV